jgi:hypothetical protein
VGDVAGGRTIEALQGEQTHGCAEQLFASDICG